MLSMYLAMLETDEQKSLVTELYNKYEQDMYRVAYGILHNKHDAEDAVSEAFIRIIKNITKISFGSDIKTRALFVIIVRNISIDFYNKGKRSEATDVLDVNTEDGDSLYEYSRLEVCGAKKLVERLPDKLRNIIVMRFVLEIDVETIAKTLNIAPVTVYSRIQKARAIMRDFLKEENDERIK